MTRWMKEESWESRSYSTADVNLEAAPGEVRLRTWVLLTPSSSSRVISACRSNSLWVILSSCSAWERGNQEKSQLDWLRKWKKKKRAVHLTTKHKGARIGICASSMTWDGSQMQLKTVKLKSKSKIKLTRNFVRKKQGGEHSNWTWHFLFLIWSQRIHDESRWNNGLLWFHKYNGPEPRVTMSSLSWAPLCLH